MKLERHRIHLEMRRIPRESRRIDLKNALKLHETRRITPKSCRIRSKTYSARFRSDRNWLYHQFINKR